MGTWTTTPRTWVAGEVPTATHFNGNLRDFGRAFADAWTSYTPTLTASTTNPTNWTQTGYYMQAGKLVHVKVQLAAGASMTAGSGTYRIALPVNANTTLTDTKLQSSVFLYDSNTGGDLRQVLGGDPDRFAAGHLAPVLTRPDRLAHRLGLLSSWLVGAHWWQGGGGPSQGGVAWHAPPPGRRQPSGQLDGTPPG